MDKEGYLEILGLMTGITEDMLEKLRAVYTYDPEEAATQLSAMSAQPKVETREVLKCYFAY